MSLIKHIRHGLRTKMAWCRVPIQSGPIKGYRWSLFTAQQFWRGIYDRSSIEQFLGLITPGACVYDVGAHMGYYTLAAAHRAGPEGRVIAFEPAPVNLGLLSGHIQANQLENVRLVPAGVSESKGVARFTSSGTGSGRGRLAEQGEQVVATVTLDGFYQETGHAPDVIKMDIEGAELMALRGAQAVLSEHHPALWLAVHSDSLRDACTDYLRSLGYVVSQAKKNTLLATDAGKQPGLATARPAPVDTAAAEPGAIPA